MNLWIPSLVPPIHGILRNLYQLRTVKKKKKKRHWVLTLRATEKKSGALQSV